MNNIESLFQEWNSLQPLSEENRQRLERKFMLEFNYNSNHLEGNTLTYGQTELLLLFGKVVDAANMKDLEDMKASNVALKMMEEAADSDMPMTEVFIRQLHKTLLREDYTVYRNLPGGQAASYVVHAGKYKTRPNSVVTRTGERFEYASPEETPGLMCDLMNWYQNAEEEGNLSPIKLASLFHYRYIRIHPFEDGNGRIARLLVNFILRRHHYPMIVVKSADKDNYLNALSLCDGFAGTAPSEGAHARIEQITPFVDYLTNCLENALRISIRAAKGLSIEEDDDFVKELKILERQKKQSQAEAISKKIFSPEEVWNVLEFVYFPIVTGFDNALKAVNDIFRFSYFTWGNLLSKTQNSQNGLHVNQVLRGFSDRQLNDFISNAKSMWFTCKLMTPQHPILKELTLEKNFYITFFEDHYFVDGILNKNFAYGTYPSEEEKKGIISQFKHDILENLKEQL